MSIGKLVAAEGLASPCWRARCRAGPRTRPGQDVSWRISISPAAAIRTSKGEALIDQNLSSPQKAPLDERLQAPLYLQDPDPQQRDKAVAILENLTARKLITPQDRFTLVKIYLTRGDWQKASSHLRGWWRKTPKTPAT